jgi:hypothetical protein
MSDEVAAAAQLQVSGTAMPPAPPAAQPFPWFPYVLLALLSAFTLLMGLALTYWRDAAEVGTVTEIRITGKPGIDLSKIEEILDTPDYFLEVRTEPGSVHTNAFGDTRVGNGLTFKLPVPLRVADVVEVRVWDEDAVGKDKLIDRVDRPGRSVDGEKFRFDLTGWTPPKSRDWQLGMALAGAGGVVLLLTVVKFVRAQVV